MTPAPLSSARLATALALWSAAAMTFGDWFWAAFHVEHRPLHGLVHGTALCAWMGLFLGLASRRPAQGIAGGALVGLLAAASFYALAPFGGWQVMFLSWILLWLALAWLASRLAGRAGGANVAARALAGSVLSAAAFYLVSDIWRVHPQDPNYVWHFAAWTFAFLPGCVALVWRKA
jgi:hypothetical protein